MALVGPDGAGMSITITILCTTLKASVGKDRVQISAVDQQAAID